MRSDPNAYATHGVACLSETQVSSAEQGAQGQRARTRSGGRGRGRMGGQGSLGGAGAGPSPPVHHGRCSIGPPRPRRRKRAGQRACSPAGATRRPRRLCRGRRTAPCGAGAWSGDWRQRGRGGAWGHLAEGPATRPHCRPSLCRIRGGGRHGSARRCDRQCRDRAAFSGDPLPNATCWFSIANGLARGRFSARAGRSDLCASREVPCPQTPSQK